MPFLDGKSLLGLLTLVAYMIFIVSLPQPWPGILAIATVVVAAIAWPVYNWFRK